MDDLISRQTAKPRYIDANEIPYCEVLDADTHKGTGRFMADKKDIDALPSVQPYTDEEIQKMQDLEQAQLDKAYELGRQSAQPERLTDDDFETIRIHLNAYKEKLCNQQRWKEADEYQRIIDRFMAFASAQPEPCEDTSCPYCHEDSDGYVTPLEKNCHAFIRFGMNGWEISLSAKGWNGSAKIMYCPMCGRKLKNDK